MSNLIVICHGNICRSPAVEAILLKEGIHNISRAVTQGAVNKRAAKKVRDYMAEKGYDLEEHRSKRLSQEEVDKAGTVLYMDKSNLENLQRHWEIMNSVRIQCLAHYHPGGNLTRIRDPNFLAKDSPEFQYAMDELVESTLNFIKVIRNDR